jgi:hypothetical protein
MSLLDTLSHILSDHKDQKIAAERIVVDLATQLLERIMSFACDNSEWSFSYQMKSSYSEEVLRVARVSEVTLRDLQA